MTLLIDADTPAYAASVVHEEDGEEQAIWEGNTILTRLLTETNSSIYNLYLTGKNNFRYEIFPEYKAERLKKPKPKHLEAVRQSFVYNWGATISDGCEADDLIGIEQTAKIAAGEQPVICTIDKDLDQVPGWHYNPGIRRKGVQITPPRRYLVSPDDALRFFYYQLLIGDSTDGIKGAIGIGKKKAEAILLGCITEEDYYQACSIFYSCEEELVQNARCLYIWRYENDKWFSPVDTSEEARIHRERIKDWHKEMASKVSNTQ